NYEQWNDGVSNECHVYDLDQKIWEQIDVPWEIVPRAFHTAVVYKDDMYLYGGNRFSTDTFTKVYKLDIKNREWSTCKVSGYEPRGRSHHTSVIYGDSMLVFGGQFCSEGILEFHFPTNTWKHWERTSLGKLYGHAAVTYLDCLLVYGGQRV